MITDGQFSAILHKNTCCEYSLESSRQGDSNEYPQHIFLLRNMKNYPSIIIKYPPYLFFCCPEEQLTSDLTGPLRFFCEFFLMPLSKTHSKQLVWRTSYNLNQLAMHKSNWSQIKAYFNPCKWCWVNEWMYDQTTNNLSNGKFLWPDFSGVGEPAVSG